MDIFLFFRPQCVRLTMLFFIAIEKHNRLTFLFQTLTKQYGESAIRIKNTEISWNLHLEAKNWIQVTFSVQSSGMLSTFISLVKTKNKNENWPDLEWALRKKNIFSNTLKGNFYKSQQDFRQLCNVLMKIQLKRPIQKSLGLKVYPLHAKYG